MKRKKYPINLMEDDVSIEDQIIENIELKKVILKFAEQLMPFIKADVAAGDISKMLERYAPVAVMTLADVMLNAKNERNKANAAEKLAYMAGYKPVEKSVSLEGDLSRMAPQQLDAFLKNAFDKLPESEKNKLINLIKDSDGTYRIPKDNEIPALLPSEIPIKEL